MTVRTTDPIRALLSLGVRIIYNEKKLVMPAAAPADAPKIFVVQRGLIKRPAWMQILKFAADRDWLVIQEFDDDPDLLPGAIKDIYYNAMGPEMFSACHGVQTSTETLGTLFSKQNDNVKVFENQIYLAPSGLKPESEKVRILFAALNRKASWQPLMENINKVLSRHDNLQVQVIQDKEFHDALKTDQKRFLESANYNDYMRHMLNSDIVLMPLEDTPQNQCKSDIKFIEAGICGTAAIASPVVYEKTIKHGETGLIAHSAAEWEAGLEKLITDHTFRRTLAGNAQTYARENRMLMQHIEKRLTWYHELWANREELNRKLKEKYPELSQ